MEQSSRWHNLRQRYVMLGPIGSLLWIGFRLLQNVSVVQKRIWTVRPVRALFPVRVRIGRSSDLDALHQIFIAEEYAPLRTIEGVKQLVDLGANVGYSSAYFLSQFPQARVLAVEPDEGNFNQCKRNLAPYANRVQLLHGAVWSTNTEVAVIVGSFGDGREWATQVDLPKTDDYCAVQAWDMNTLIAETGASEIDLLKIDIERSELELFSEIQPAWLSRIRNLCVELHGEDCKQAFFRSLTGFSYDLQTAGELTICRDIRARST